MFFTDLKKYIQKTIFSCECVPTHQVFDVLKGKELKRKFGGHTNACLSNGKAVKEQLKRKTH